MLQIIDSCKFLLAKIDSWFWNLMRITIRYVNLTYLYPPGRILPFWQNIAWLSDFRPEIEFNIINYCIYRSDQLFKSYRWEWLSDLWKVVLWNYGGCNFICILGILYVGIYRFSFDSDIFAINVGIHPASQVLILIVYNGTFLKVYEMMLIMIYSIIDHT